MLDSTRRENKTAAPTAFILDNMITERNRIGKEGLYIQRRVPRKDYSYPRCHAAVAKCKFNLHTITNDQLVAIAAKKSISSRKRCLCTLPADSIRVITALYETCLT